MLYYIFSKFCFQRYEGDTAETGTESKGPGSVFFLSISSCSNLLYLFDILKFSMKFCVF